MRRAVVEVTDPLPPRTNIMLRLEAEVGKMESLEGYAKVIHPIEEQDKRYLIHFTPVSPKLQARVHRLASRGKNA